MTGETRKIWPVLGMAVSLAWLSTRAEAATCPTIYPECLDALECIDDDDRLREGGAPEWAIEATEVIRSGALGKAPLDVIRWRSGHVDLGQWHVNIRPGELLPSTGRPLQSSDDWGLALLYWDRAENDYRALLEEWAGSVWPSVRYARRSGCEGRLCSVVVASIANSSPTLARRLGDEHGWCLESMIDDYGESGRPGSLHRPRRAERLRGLL